MKIAPLRRSGVAEGLREREVQSAAQCWRWKRFRQPREPRFRIPSSRHEVDQYLEGCIQAVQQRTEAGNTAPAVVLGGIEVADGAGCKDASRPSQLGQLPGRLRTKDRRSHAASVRSRAAVASLWHR